MRELARVLAPRGIAAIRVSALDLLRSRHSEFARERQRFTRARLMALTRRHGLRVRSCTYANALLSPVAFAKFRLIEPFLKRPPESGVQPLAPWLNRLLYASLYCESWWIGAGRRFPFGQSLILLAEKQ